MKKKLLLLAIALLLCIGGASAQTAETEFALFKRTVAPVMKWGENGLITVPKATTLGKANFFVGIQGQKAGELEGLGLYLTSASILAGTSDDVELGYTRRQLIWEDLYFTNLSMDTFHLKTRFLNFGKYLIPQLALGVNAVSLVDNKFENRNDILFNPYLVATSTLPIFSEKLGLISVTALAETIMNENALGTIQFSGGVDANLFGFLYAAAEIQGFNPTTPNNEVVNLGAKVKLGIFSAGVGVVNIIRTKDTTGDLLQNAESSEFNLENMEWVATLAVDIPLGNMFAPKKR